MTENQKDKMQNAQAGKTTDKGPPLKIGELLFRQGYLKKEDIDKALCIQEHEKIWLFGSSCAILLSAWIFQEVRVLAKAGAVLMSSFR